MKEQEKGREVRERRRAAEQQENRQADENRKIIKEFVSKDFSQTAKPSD